MKRRLFILYAILGIPFIMLGQGVHEISLSFNENDFLFTEDNGKLNISTSKYVSSLEEDTLKPALPYIGINYLIRPGEEMASFTYTDTETLIRENVTMSNNPKPQPTNCLKEPTTGTPIFDYQKQVFPIDHVNYTGTHYMNGYKIISFSVCPFKYDDVQNKLYLKNNVRIEVLTNPSREVTSISPYNRAEHRKMVEEVLFNKRDIDLFYDNSSMNRNRDTSLYDYVIVTNDSLKTPFLQLARWKTIKGIRTKVLTTSEIDSIYNGADLQVKIKRAFEDYYNNYGIEYALLGGDIDVVPSRMCYVSYFPYIDNSPTDLYYACFDNNFEWNQDNDTIYGEIVDNIDVIPEITVSRIPVRSTIDAANVVNRIIEYESNPKTDNWVDNILMAGVMLYHYTDGISDSQIKSEEVFSTSIYPYWNWCERYRLYDTGTDLK